jgi:large subunit ribosomal protein L18
MKQKLFTVQYRRKREGKTDYRKRLGLLVSEKPRLVVRRSQKHILAQIIAYHQDGDKVLAQAHTGDLAELGWKYSTKNMPASYLVGLLAGKRALSKGVKESILDIGLQSPIGKSKIYACLKGAVDSGMSIPHSKEIFPSDDRIKGMHIVKYKPKDASQFSRYSKEGSAPDKIAEAFLQVKASILKV